MFRSVQQTLVGEGVRAIRTAVKETTGVWVEGIYEIYTKSRNLGKYDVMCCG